MLLGDEGESRGEFTVSVKKVNMRACWMFVMLLSCRSSHATKYQDSCECNGRIKIVRVGAGDDVPVPCPNLTAEVVILSLFKDDKVISNHTCTDDKQTPTCNSRYSRDGVELREHNKSVSFMLTRVNASSYGIYGCEAIREFPPPVINRTACILLLVDGHQCNSSTDSTPEDQKDEFLWVWILGLTLLCTYSLIITIIAAIIWVMWRRSDFQSDYMNTKPKAHKDRRKNKGVQIPIPRRF